MEFFRDVYAESDAELGDSEFTGVEVVEIVRNGCAEIEALLYDHNFEGALEPLLDLYEILKTRKYFIMIQEEIGFEEFLKIVTWVCYRICYCYMEEKDYVRAFFYIDQVRGNNTECFMEWINVYVNSERIDALGIVEYYAKEPSRVREIFQEDADFKKVMDFLDRRLGYLYIQVGQYEDAREVFTRMLDNPASNQFAREELEYLDEIEKRE